MFFVISVPKFASAFTYCRVAVIQGSSEATDKKISNILEYDGCTANVCRELHGLCREIGVQGFQIYRDCMYTRNPCNMEISTFLFPCKNCRDFDFTGKLWGYPTLNVGKSCKKIFFVDISVKFVGISCKF